MAHAPAPLLLPPRAGEAADEYDVEHRTGVAVGDEVRLAGGADEPPGGGDERARPGASGGQANRRCPLRQASITAVTVDLLTRSAAGRRGSAHVDEVQAELSAADRDRVAQLQAAMRGQLLPRLRPGVLAPAPTDPAVARSGRDALAWCVRLAGRNADTWLSELREALQALEKARAAGRDASASTA